VKKYLVVLLAMVFAMGICGTALADSANPFTDVPLGHWAYSAVTKLANDGVIEGYGDGTYLGDKSITRYEMAQIIARAMAKSDKASAEDKALIDKLAVEFANELNALGVRVSKLEAKTNIGLTYESRIRYGGDSNQPSKMQGSNAYDFRQRINLAGAINDKTTYGARLETGNVAFGSGASASVGFDRMFFTFNNVIFDQTTIGRFSTNGVTNGLLNSRTGNNDGVKIVTKLGNAAKFTGIYYDVKPYTDADGNIVGSNEVGIANIDFKVGDSSNINVAYQTTHLDNAGKWPTTNALTNFKAKSLDIGGYTKLGNVWLTGEYVRTDLRDNAVDSGKAWAIQLTNGVTPVFYPINSAFVDTNKPHTAAFSLSYRKVDSLATPFTSAFKGADPVAAVEDGANGTLAQDDNVKGYYLAYQNVLSKGVVFTVEYQSLKNVVGNGKDNVYASSFQFYF
jgi:hypothetical protein